MNENACVWTERGDHIWDSACGYGWQFVDDVQWEQMRYCHACGKPLVREPAPMGEKF